MLLSNSASSSSTILEDNATKQTERTLYFITLIISGSYSNQLYFGSLTFARNG